MTPIDEIEQSIRNLRLHTRPELDERILEDAAEALSRPAVPEGKPVRVARRWVPAHWRRWAIAAGVVLAAGLAWMVAPHGSRSSAYALEQTLAANRALRSIHLRNEPPREISEAWAELNEDGSLRRLRMIWPVTEDGPKDVVWQADKAEVWFKAKKAVGVFYESDMLKRLPQFYQTFDPAEVMKALYQRQAEGKVTIETVMPTQAGEQIVLKVAPVKPEFWREIYRVDPNTKLVCRFERYDYDIQTGQATLVWASDYLEYNQPIADEVFVRTFPDDVIRIDETTQIIGLAKGDLTDEQITAQVAREFFEALIAKDYVKAGQLFSGMPASKMEQLFAKANFTRIVSIGQARPHWIPGVGGQIVSVKVEFEQDGMTLTKEFRPAVRPVHSQPDRWAIHGGI